MRGAAHLILLNLGRRNMRWARDGTGGPGYRYRFFHVGKGFCCLSQRTSPQETGPCVCNRWAACWCKSPQFAGALLGAYIARCAGLFVDSMLPNLVGVRLVSEGGEVLRDWALHFKPNGGGSLAEFFEEIATGKNDSGDGFVLPNTYDSKRVKARVSDAKGGQEMTIPASAAFQDATGFGQWFTFHIPPRQDAKDKAQERDIPRVAAKLDKHPPSHEVQRRPTPSAFPRKPWNAYRLRWLDS